MKRVIEKCLYNKYLLEGDFAALSLLRFPLGLTSKSGFSVSFQIMPSILESESLKTTQR